MPGDPHAARFTDLRPLLFTIAYEIFGSVVDADDVLQESWLRWEEVDLETVRDHKAYLARVVTRQALNSLRSASRRREEYVGPWLPEPLLTAGDPASDVILAESVSTAMMVVLETLSPDERVVFVLREVFDFSHEEIAAIVEKSPAAVRQSAHRARKHVLARRTRFAPVDRERATAVTGRFLESAATGDLTALLALLAPDATWISDGGGKVSAARRPVTGADRVARLVLGLVQDAAAAFTAEPGFYNGSPALVLHRGVVVDSVVTLEIVDGRVSNLYVVRNPDKLRDVLSTRAISRVAQPGSDDDLPCDAAGVGPEVCWFTTSSIDESGHR